VEMWEKVPTVSSTSCRGTAGVGETGAEMGGDGRKSNKFGGQGTKISSEVAKLGNTVAVKKRESEKDW